MLYTDTRLIAFSIHILPRSGFRLSIPLFDEMPRFYRKFLFSVVPAGSPSRGGDVLVYCFDVNQLSLPIPFFYSVLVSVSVFMALSTVFHSINSPANSSFSRSVLQVLSLSYWSFQLYVSLWKSPSALI